MRRDGGRCGEGDGEGWREMERGGVGEMGRDMFSDKIQIVMSVARIRTFECIHLHWPGSGSVSRKEAQEF